jgi:hypothetical protein
VNKTIFGLLLGGFLGIFDGLTAWFTPVARPRMVEIVVGSTIKGLVTGICIGYFAKKVHSLALGIVFGLAVGMFLAFLIALNEQGHYFEIMLPGSVLGAVVGFATQRYKAGEITT